MSQLYPFSDYVTKSYADCPQIHLRDTTNMMEINLRPDLNPRADCESSEFRPKQTEGIDSNCLLEALITNLVYLLSRSSVSLRQKWGFGQNRQDLRTEVIDLINKRCAGRNPTLVLGMSKIVVPICAARVNQGGTDLTACMINFLQDLMIQIENDPSREENKYAVSNRLPLLMLIAFFIILIYLIS